MSLRWKNFTCISWLCCCCCFLLLLFAIFFIFNLNFNRNRQNIVTMKFQDTSCPPLAESVLSSSVEPQSLAVSVSSSLDVTAMTRRSTWSSTAIPVAQNPFSTSFTCRQRNALSSSKWTQMHLPSAFLRLSSLTSGLTWLIITLAQSRLAQLSWVPHVKGATGSQCVHVA